MRVIDALSYSVKLSRVANTGERNRRHWMEGGECRAEGTNAGDDYVPGSNLHLTINTGSVKNYHGPGANTHTEK